MTICGTGHRPDKAGGYTDEAFGRLVIIAVQWLCENRPAQVISGMALGWDFALAEAARSLRIPFIAAVPFDGQESKWRYDGGYYTRFFYYNLLKAAREVVYVSEPGYAAWKLHRRNHWMVDRADTVLALWNGDREGGTFRCLQYAHKCKRPVVNLWKKL